MGLSLYIHIPFCKSKCFYCSFTSFEKKDNLTGPYLEALKKEALAYSGRRIDTVYIGGGTPSHLSSSQIKTLFAMIHSNFEVAKDAEVTVEVNPATLTPEKAGAMLDCGVNRASLGVQSLDDRFLVFLGRPHNASDAYVSFRELRDSGFKNINLDLIYSMPGQTREEVAADVTGLVSFGSEHISLYTLAIAEGSDFFRRNIKLPCDEEQGRDYIFVSKSLERGGFFRYEVSNFSRPGYACLHNLNYWRGGDYIGLGVSAHSNIDGCRYWNSAELETYLEMMRQGPGAVTGREELPQEKRFMEALLIGLRLAEGVDVADLQERFEVALPKEKEEAINDIIEHGLLRLDAGRLKATLSGVVVLDGICSRLI